jgi:hypothetical protein
MQETEGAAITMAHGSIWLSATRHLWLEAAGDIRLIAGQNIFMKARRSIELVATVGGLILKARTWWKALCERGTMRLKSDADASVAYTPEQGDPAAEVLSAAVLLEADNGKISVEALKRVKLQAYGTPDDGDASVLIESSKQDVRVRAKNDISLFSNNLKFMVTKEWDVRSKDILWTATGLFDVNQFFAIRQGQVFARNFIGGQVAAQSALIGPTQHATVKKGLVLKLASNEERETVSRMVPPTPVAPNSARWTFSAPEEYLWDMDELHNCGYATPSQQTLAKSEGAATWAWSMDRLLPASTTGPEHQSFGGGMKVKTHSGGSLMNKPAGDMAAHQATGWTSDSVSFRFIPYPTT